MHLVWCRQIRWVARNRDIENVPMYLKNKIMAINIVRLVNIDHKIEYTFYNFQHILSWT